MCNCNNGCDSCKEQIYGVCGLLEGTDIKIEDQTQTGTCCKTYKISSLVNVDSPDNSIGVTKTGNTFHLKGFKFDSNTHDRLMAVNSADTPGYATQKFVSTCNNILTITPKQISIGQWVLDFCIDPSKINVKDEKVAASSGCTPKYLQDILKTNYTDYFQFVKQGYDVSLRVTEKDRFLAHIRTNDMYVSGALPLDTTGYGVIPSSIWSTESTMPGQISDLTFSGSIAGGGNNTKVITIPYDGWYGVGFGGSGKTSQGVVTVRNQVVVYRGGAEALRIFDDRFSGSRHEDLNNNGKLDPNEFNYPIGHILESGLPAGKLAVDASLSTAIRGFGFGAYRLLQLKKDDILAFMWKVAVEGDNLDYIISPQVGYTAQGNDTLTNGRGAGVFVTVQEELVKKINK